MSANCSEQYRLALLNDLLNLSRTVNYRICTGAMCPYISGAPGSGVHVDESDSLNPHVVFVAINTEALTDPISFNFVTSTVSNKEKIRIEHIDDSLVVFYHLKRNL